MRDSKREDRGNFSLRLMLCDMLVISVAVTTLILLATRSDPNPAAGYAVPLVPMFWGFLAVLILLAGGGVIYRDRFPFRTQNDPSGWALLAYSVVTILIVSAIGQLVALLGGGGSLWIYAAVMPLYYASRAYAPHVLLRLRGV